ncbi:MAG TPA: bifunctional dTDP-4-dehydrorhamnose 3,5-epimerase family protein/NAD(P)-dependent oxidoreductase [Candidatus Saccharimonadales bacterium]
MSTSVKFSKELSLQETSIPGLVILDLTVFGDNRGWFKENWQREKMVALGLPDFGPVQNNFSFNNAKGVLRGIHAEPWDKFISVGSGSFFGAWVDIREGSPTYGTVFTTEIDASKAIFVPAGVANSYLTLEDNTVYSYLVNDHWHPDAKYTFINAADPDLAIKWPIPLEQCELSEKDKKHPMFKDITPVPAKKVLITGANGQLGNALRKIYPNAEFTDRSELDITSDLSEARHWRDYGTIINAAAYTAVDAAETPEGKKLAWQVNGVGVQQLATIAAQFNITLVNVSSDYVFDGTATVHDENEQLSPLGVYAQTKAAGELLTKIAPNHYLVRTSWVVGEGNNFVLTMKSLAERDIKPSVVDDQVGRLTFADDLAQAIKHLIDTKAPFGTYNVSNEGEPASWAAIAGRVYEAVGKSASDITPVTTAEYYKGKEGIAPRPLQSTLNLDKIKATGFVPRHWEEALHQYLDQQ